MYMWIHAAMLPQQTEAVWLIPIIYNIHQNTFCKWRTSNARLHTDIVSQARPTSAREGKGELCITRPFPSLAEEGPAMLDYTHMYLRYCRCSTCIGHFAMLKSNSWDFFQKYTILVSTPCKTRESMEIHFAYWTIRISKFHTKYTNG